MPLPSVKHEDWYEIRLYLPKERMPISQFFKAGCHTESRTIAEKLSKERKAIHYDLGKSSLKDVIPEEVRGV